MNNTPKLKVNELNEALHQKMSTKTEKQLEKERKQREQHWNSMVSRREVFEIVDSIRREQDEKLRLLLIQVKTITNFLVEKGLCTLEDLDKLSIPIVKELYGEAVTTDAPPTKEPDTSDTEK